MKEAEINVKEGCMYHLVLTSGWNADVYYRGRFGSAFGFSRKEKGRRFYMYDENIVSCAEITKEEPHA